MTTTLLFPAVEMGSVSHGTMLPEDLIPTFMSVLEEHDPTRAEGLWTLYLDVFAEMEADDFDRFDDYEAAGFLLETLFEALDDLAPFGSYFGSHEGDGSDYGYWSCINDDPSECS